MTRTEYLTGRVAQLDVRDAPPPEALSFVIAARWPEEAVNRKRAAGWRQYSDMLSPMPAGYHRLKDGARIDFAGRRWRHAVGRGHSLEHACPELGSVSGRATVLSQMKALVVSEY